MATAHRGVPLPQRTTTYVRVLYPKLGSPVSFLSYSTSVVGHMMHFGDKHSHPCLREYTTCPWCGPTSKTLWYGWLFGSDLRKRGLALLQLTETAVRNNEILRDPDRSVRGAKIELERVADNKGSFVRAVVNTGYSTMSVPPGEPDVVNHLFDFYKLTPFLARTTFKTEEFEQ